MYPPFRYIYIPPQIGLVSVASAYLPSLIYIAEKCPTALTDSWASRNLNLHIYLEITHTAITLRLNRAGSWIGFSCKNRLTAWQTLLLSVEAVKYVFLSRTTALEDSANVDYASEHARLRVYPETKFFLGGLFFVCLTKVKVNGGTTPFGSLQLSIGAMKRSPFPIKCTFEEYSLLLSRARIYGSDSRGY